MEAYGQRKPLQMFTALRVDRCHGRGVPSGCKRMNEMRNALAGAANKVHAPGRDGRRMEAKGGQKLGQTRCKLGCGFTKAGQGIGRHWQT